MERKATQADDRRRQRAEKKRKEAEGEAKRAKLDLPATTKVTDRQTDRQTDRPIDRPKDQQFEPWAWETLGALGHYGIGHGFGPIFDGSVKHVPS